MERILSARPEELWQQTMRYSGIAEEYFFQYFAGRSIAHAIKIKNTKKYAHALPLQEHYHVAPPQSYVYL